MTERVPANSLLVAIPSIGMVLSEAYESMLLAFSRGRAYWERRYPLATFALRVVHRKPADNARNVLAGTAVEGGFDWIWWVDDDMEIPDDALERLHARDATMASGLYCLKESPVRPLVFRHASPPEGGPPGWYRLELEPSQCHGQAWVDATGLGCFLMKREPLEKVYRATDGEPFRWSMETTDDIHFFKRTHELGYKILMDMDLRLGHWGHHRWDVG